MRIKLEMTDKPVYQGQRVPIDVVWSYAGDISQVSNLSIRCELFDRFEFSDPPVTDESTLLPLQTMDGTIKVPATVTERIIDGERFIQLSAKRFLLADQPGTIDVGPIRASIRVGGSSRDIFDSFFSDPFARRKPSIPVRAQGQPRRLVIKPLPLDGRPQSFAGAVGTGFNLDVQANRTVVRVGDPISLTITVRGDGNLNQAGLPALSADGGMSPAQFRLPTEEVSGVYHDGQKQFTVAVRVEDEAVSELPPLAFSWFNPDKEQYETTRSAPVALQVMPAQIVSSADVVSAATPEPSTINNDAAATSAQPTSPATSGLDAAAGADLAIETDIAILSRGGPSQRVQQSVTIALYGLGLAAVVGAFLDQRRRQTNPVIRQRQRLLADQSKRIRAASSQAAGAAAETLADALRQLLPLTEHNLRQETESLIAKLETIIYAPDKPAANLDSQLLEAARDIAHRVDGGSA